MSALTESGHVQITRDVDLVYSPDDFEASGKGFYLHRYKPTDSTSQLFASAEDALAAFQADSVEWEA